MRRRPLLLRMLPPRLAGALFWRGYRNRWPRAGDLYRSAPLRFAPRMAMVLVPGDAISDSIAFTGFFELDLTRRIVAAARSGAAPRPAPPAQ